MYVPGGSRRLSKRAELMGDVVLQHPDAPISKEAQLVLEGDAVELNPVEQHLLLDDLPELRGLAETK